MKILNGVFGRKERAIVVSNQVIDGQLIITLNQAPLDKAAQKSTSP